MKFRGTLLRKIKMTKLNKYKERFGWSDDQLACRATVAGRQLACFDVESYKNFSLVVTIDATGIHAARSDKMSDFEAAVRRLFKNEIVYVGFNNYLFDNSWINTATNNTAANFDRGQRLILDDDTRRSYRIFNSVETIDLIDLRAANEKVGLKGLAARGNAKIIQELPYAIDAELTEEQRDDVTAYCINDTVETLKFLSAKLGEIELRDSLYNQFLRGTNTLWCKFLSSKGAAVAETILKTLLDINTTVLDSDACITEADGRDLVPEITFQTKELEDHYNNIYENKILLRSSKDD